jgi:hypothetical protein
MQTMTVGLFTGLILGLALALEGFGAMVIVAFFGALGHLVARVIDGEVDLSAYVGPPAETRKSGR